MGIEIPNNNKTIIGGLQYTDVLNYLYSKGYKIIFINTTSDIMITHLSKM